MNRRTWTTKEGKEINISDMTDTHLYNTFLMMYREGSNRRDTDYANILDECHKRGMKPISNAPKMDKIQHNYNKYSWSEEQDIFSDIIQSNYFDFHS